MKDLNPNKTGGLLVGETDKNGGEGIKVIAPEGEIRMGGGEIIINEEASKKHCEELSKINESTGGVKIPCDAQKTANTTDNSSRMDCGGKTNHTMEKKISLKDGGKAHRKILHTLTLAQALANGKVYYKTFEGEKTHEEVFSFYSEKGITPERTQVELVHVYEQDRDLEIFKKFLQKLVKDQFGEEISEDSLMFKRHDFGALGFEIDSFDFKTKSGKSLFYDATELEIYQKKFSGGPVAGSMAKGGQLDPVAQREIQLFIENDGDLYRQQIVPIQKNLMTKLAQGKYDRALAPKLFIYLIEAGDKKYQKEVSGQTPKGYMLSVEDRKALAVEMEKEFYENAKSGEYNQYIPAKYKDKEIAYDHKTMAGGGQVGGEIKRKISFGKIAYRGKAKSNEVTVEIRLKHVVGDEKRTTDLKEITEYYEFACSGNIWNSRHTDIVSGGQNLDEIKKVLPNNELFNKIFKLWNEYHLNDMNAGTTKQSEAIEKWEAEGNTYSYDGAVEHLKSIGLYEDRGYKYGHAWLVREIPADALKEMKEIIEGDEKKMAEGGKISEVDLNDFINGYKSGILFTATDDEENPLDSNYSISDFSEKSNEVIKKMAEQYISENQEAIEISQMDYEQIGTDVWFAQSGQGAGFFDRNLDDEIEKELTAGAKKFGDLSHHVFAQDGEVFIEGMKFPESKKMAGGGKLGKWSGRYLTLEETSNGLKIIISEEGKEELQAHEIEGEEVYLEPFFLDLFDDIRGNSELLYFSDAGEAGLGLTSAPAITDGYFYNDEGDLDEHDDSKLFYYDGYMLHDFARVLLEKGEVFFHKAGDSKEDGGEVETMAEGGDVKHPLSDSPDYPKAEELKGKLNAIIEKTLPKFWHRIVIRKNYFGQDLYLQIQMAVNDKNINNVEGQKPQCVSLALEVKTMELRTQVFGGNGGGWIYRKPNMEDAKEKYLAMKSVKVPFRQPKKDEKSVLKAFEKFCVEYKKLLIENREVLKYQDIVNYDEVLGTKSMAQGGNILKNGVPFQNSNLYLYGKDRDLNGNSTVRVGFPNDRSFTIQTNGTLPETQYILQRAHKEISDEELNVIEKEVVDYVSKFGSKKQKSKLKTYGSMAKGGKAKKKATPVVTITLEKAKEKIKDKKWDQGAGNNSHGYYPQNAFDIISKDGYYATWSTNGITTLVTSGGIFEIKSTEKQYDELVSDSMASGGKAKKKGTIVFYTKDGGMAEKFFEEGKEAEAKKFSDEVGGSFTDIKYDKGGKASAQGVKTEAEHENLYNELSSRLSKEGVKMPMSKKEFFEWIASMHESENKDYYSLLKKYIESKAKADTKKEGKASSVKNMCPAGTEIQTLIFEKKDFSKKSALDWAKKHDFKSKLFKAEQTENSIRIRQQKPSSFKKTSFKTIDLTDGVKAVVACPRANASKK